MLVSRDPAEGVRQRSKGDTGTTASMAVVWRRIWGSPFLGSFDGDCQSHSNLVNEQIDAQKQSLDLACISIKKPEAVGHFWVDRRGLVP